jgi:hypothetical protein
MDHTTARFELHACDLWGTISGMTTTTLNMKSLVPAYLIEWVDERGTVLKLQTASEFPVTELFDIQKPRQRLAAMAVGRDFHSAHDNLLEMLDRADPSLGRTVRKLCRMGR